MTILSAVEDARGGRGEGSVGRGSMGHDRDGSLRQLSLGGS